MDKRDPAEAEDEGDTLPPMSSQQQPQQQQPQPAAVPAAVAAAVAAAGPNKLSGRRGTLLAAPGAVSSGPRKSIAGVMLSRATLMSLGNLARRSKAQDVRLENTYRTQPKEEERLKVWRLRPTIVETLAEVISGYAYNAATAGRKACDAALAIRNRTRECGFDRYKLVVFVLVTENRKAAAPPPGGACLASRALWSAGECADNFTEAACASDTARAHATVHAFYYE